MLKRLSILLAAGAFVVALAPAAQAFAPAPLGAIAAADVIQVRDGCGRGFFRDRWGRCRPMARGRVVCRQVWVSGRGWRTVCR